MQERGRVSLKAKKIIPDYAVALIIAALTVAMGILAINMAMRLLPDHKDAVAVVDMADAPSFSSGFDDIMNAWPWTLIADEPSYGADMPEWLRNSLVRLAEAFPGHVKISLSESELYFNEGLYFVKNVRLDSGEKQLIMSAAYEMGGEMISFNIDPADRGEYEATVINECYRAVCDSAEYHRLNGSSTDITYYLGMLQEGLFDRVAVEVDEEYFDSANPNLSESESILYIDPISDFFYSYCIMLEGKDEYYSALPIISLLNNESPKSYYRDGKIYLFYENTGLGALTLSWDLETFRFAGMTYKKP